jgi:hypothetical protein
MLNGSRAFSGGSAVEVMNAILKEEPPELSETNTKVSPQLEKIVRRCLEKKPERRFQSASDLGFALEALSTPSGSRLETAVAFPAMTERRVWRERIAWVVAGLAVLAALAALSVAYFNRSTTDARRAAIIYPAGELGI